MPAITGLGSAAALVGVLGEVGAVEGGPEPLGQPAAAARPEFLAEAAAGRAGRVLGPAGHAGRLQHLADEVVRLLVALRVHQFPVGVAEGQWVVEAMSGVEVREVGEFV